MNALRSLLVIAAAAALTACDSNDSSIFPTQTPTTFDVQVLHASSDAPAVNVLVDGSEVLGGVDYKSGSPRLRLDEGSYSIQVDGLTPSGAATVIGPVDLAFTGQRIYSIVAVGNVGDNTLEPVVISQERTAVSAGAARVYVLHASPVAQSAFDQVDVFVTTPGANLVDPLGTFSFKETLGPVEVAAGDYQIRVTPAGDTATVLYDSGTVTLNDGDDLLVSAVDNTAAGDAPISLVVLTGSGSAEILAAGTPADLRVVHASADAPNVDVIVNNAVTIVSNLAFPDATGFLSVDAANYDVAVTEAGNAGNPVIQENLTLDAGVTYDVIALGNLGTPISALVAADDYRRVATEAKLRVIHASPTAQNVDVYVSAPGTDINNEDPTLTDVPFEANTGFLGLAPDDYEVTVTPAGSKTAAIGPAPITIDAGGIYTIIARDAAGGGAVSASPILLDDFQP